MKKQNYRNHVRYYPPHHFVFLPLLSFLLILGIVKAGSDSTNRLEWILFSILSFCILYLAIMLRQHYALGNQDRIVRLEFRLRYFELFHKSAGSIEEKLDFKQIAALRFADDEEFKKLLQKALVEDMNAGAIKKGIANWQADDMRV